MNATEALVRLSLTDTELGKFRAREKEATGQITSQRNAVAADEKKTQQLERDATTAARAVQSAIALLTNEEEQYSKREKQLTDMGGAKSAKAISAENDRATLVIEALQIELATKRDQLSNAETVYLEAADALQTKKERFVLSEKELCAQLEDLRARIAEIQKDRELALKDVDPAILPKYEKLISRYAEAVTTIDDSACALCNTMVPVRISHPVKAGTPQQCPGCDRFLVNSLAVGEPAAQGDMI